MKKRNSFQNKNIWHNVMDTKESKSHQYKAGFYILLRILGKRTLLWQCDWRLPINANNLSHRWWARCHTQVTCGQRAKLIALWQRKMWNLYTLGRVVIEYFDLTDGQPACSTFWSFVPIKCKISINFMAVGRLALCPPVDLGC